MVVVGREGVGSRMRAFAVTSPNPTNPFILPPKSIFHFIFVGGAPKLGAGWFLGSPLLFDLLLLRSLVINIMMEVVVCVIDSDHHQS